jgi:uncharacterized protein (DUF2062 family)
MHFPSYVIGALLCAAAGYLRETYVSRRYEREIEELRERRAREKARADAWRHVAERAPCREGGGDAR